MALMEKPDFCSIAEYKQAFEERLKEGDLSDEELLNLYLRVHGHHEALRVPALVTKRVRRNIGSVGVFVTLLNEDLKPCTRSIPGVMDQRGVWNTADRDSNIQVRSGGVTRQTNDGVFRNYDGLGLDFLLPEQELTLAHGAASSDQSTFLPA